MPDLFIEGGTNGKWSALAELRGEDVGDDVVDLETQVPGRHAEVRLRFDPHATGDLALADVEIWAEPK